MFCEDEKDANGKANGATDLLRSGKEIQRLVGSDDEEYTYQEEHVGHCQQTSIEKRYHSEKEQKCPCRCEKYTKLLCLC